MCGMFCNNSVSSLVTSMSSVILILGMYCVHPLYIMIIIYYLYLIYNMVVPSCEANMFMVPYCLPGLLPPRLLLVILPACHLASLHSLCLPLHCLVSSLLDHSLAPSSSPCCFMVMVFTKGSGAMQPCLCIQEGVGGDMRGMWCWC